MTIDTWSLAATTRTVFPPQRHSLRAEDTNHVEDTIQILRSLGIIVGVD